MLPPPMLNPKEPTCNDQVPPSPEHELSIRPRPRRAITASTAVDIPIHKPKAADPGDLSTSPDVSPTHNTKPSLTRSHTATSLSSLFKRSNGHNSSSNFFSRSSGSGTGMTSPTALFGLSMGRTSGSRTPTVPNSPQLQALLKNKIVPDMHAVNLALEELAELKRSSSTGDIHGQNAYVQGLTRLATEMQKASHDGDAQLRLAMRARNEGKSEVCRGLCLQIVESKHGRVWTKVQALNALSLLASSSEQAREYLGRATELGVGEPEWEGWGGLLRGLRGGWRSGRASVRARVRVWMRVWMMERVMVRVSSDGRCCVCDR